MYDVSLITDHIYFSFIFVNDLTTVNIYKCKLLSTTIDF